MRHSDYLQTMRCKICGHWIYMPVTWTSKKFSRPLYGTCEHVNIKLRKEVEKHEGRGAQS